MVVVSPGDTLSFAPWLRRGGGVEQGIPGAAARLRRGNSNVELSEQHDATTGRVTGRLIIPGTARGQQARTNQQDDLFAQILGGFGRDYFPEIDPVTGQNVSDDFRLLRPEQIEKLRQGLGNAGGTLPIGEQIAQRFAPGIPTVSAEELAAPAPAGAGLPIVPIAIAGGVLVLLLLLTGKKKRGR